MNSSIKAIVDWVNQPLHMQIRFIVRLHIAVYAGFLGGLVIAFGSIVFYPEQTALQVEMTKIIMAITMMGLAYYNWKWSVWVNHVWRGNGSETER